MKRTELVILLAGLAVCSVYSNTSVIDFSLLPRHIVWAIVTLLLSTLIILRNANLGFIKHPIVLCFFGYCMMTVVSGTNAVNLGEWVFESLKVLMRFIYLICAVVVLKKYKNAVIKFLVLIGAGLIIYGLFTRIDGMGTMNHKNLWASALFLLLPFCIYSMSFKRWKIVSIAVACAIVGVLLMMNVRTVWVALFIFGMFFTRRWYFVLGAFGVIAIALLCIKQDPIFHYGTLGWRLFKWDRTLKMAADNPMGVGAGNWRVRVPEYNDGYMLDEKLRPSVEVTFQRPHNDFLWVLSETGLIGFLFYLSVFGLAIYCLRGQRILLAAMCGCIAVSFFSFPKERAFHSMIYMLLFAFAVVNYTPKFNCIRAYPGIIALALLSVCISVFIIRLKVEQDIRDIFVAKMNGNWQGVLDITEDYTKLSSIDSLAFPVQFHRGQAYEETGDEQRALNCFRQAEKQNPYNVFVLNRLGRAYYYTGDTKEALKCFNRALEICPTYEFTLTNLERIKAAK